MCLGDEVIATSGKMRKHLHTYFCNQCRKTCRSLATLGSRMGGEGGREGEREGGREGEKERGREGCVPAQHVKLALGVSGWGCL